MVENGDVVAVALRIVGANQTEQRGFAAAVFAKQCPFFACRHSPAHLLEYDVAAVHHVAGVKAECGGKRLMAVHLPLRQLWQLAWLEKPLALLDGFSEIVAVHIDCFAYLHIVHRNYMLCERRYVCRVAKQQHHGCALCHNVLQQVVEQFAALFVEPDIRIVYNQDVGAESENVYYEKFAQLAAREEIDVLVDDVARVQPLAKVVPHVEAYFAVDELAHGGNVVVSHTFEPLLVVCLRETRKRMNIRKLNAANLKAFLVADDAVGGEVPAVFNDVGEGGFSAAVAANHGVGFASFDGEGVRVLQRDAAKIFQRRAHSLKQWRGCLIHANELNDENNLFYLVLRWQS